MKRPNLVTGIKDGKIFHANALKTFSITLGRNTPNLGKIYPSTQNTIQTRLEKNLYIPAYSQSAKSKEHISCIKIYKKETPNTKANLWNNCRFSTEVSYAGMAWNCAFKALTSNPEYFIQQVEGEKNYTAHTRGRGEEVGRLTKIKPTLQKVLEGILEARKASEKHQTHQNRRKANVEQEDTKHHKIKKMTGICTKHFNDSFSVTSIPQSSNRIAEHIKKTKTKTKQTPSIYYL